MADIFISYAREDENRIKELVPTLEEYEWSIFWDRRIPVGKSWESYIEQNLSDAKCVIVAWSHQSIKSKWVKIEATDAEERGVMVPVLLDNVKPPLAFRHIQTADLVNWNPAQSSLEFEKLIADISIILGPSPKQVKEAELEAERAKQAQAKQKAEALSKFEEEVTEKAKIAALETGEKYRIPVQKPLKESPLEYEEVQISEPIPLQPEPANGELPETRTDPKGTTGSTTPDQHGKSILLKISLMLAVILILTAGIWWFISVPRKGKIPVSKQQQELAESETIERTRLKNSIGMEFVLIPAGTFTMGSNAGEDYEKPLRNVKMSRPFYIQTTEVTQGQWEKVMGDNPSNFKQCGDGCPVENVSWADAKRFIEKLNKLEKTKVYRLPTEAEWEYACRSGTNTDFYTGDTEKDLDKAGWYSKNSKDRTRPVGEKEPNAQGLYDMHGNVWEWVEDDWHGSYEKAPDDGQAWVNDLRDSYRIVRGGSGGSPAQYCRSASRISYRLDYCHYYVGFRLAKTIALSP